MFCQQLAEIELEFGLYCVLLMDHVAKYHES